MNDELKCMPLELFANTDFDKYADNNRGDKLGGVIPHLGGLMLELIKRYPQWNFVAISGNYHERLVDGTKVRLATKFGVYEKREMIGFVGYDRSYARGDQYVVGNDRISASKDRQSCTKTTKLDVALRLVKKNFSPKTTDEYFEKSIEVVTENINRLVIRANQDTRGYYNALQTKMAQYVRNNWSSFVDTLNQEGKDTCAKYMEAHEKLDINQNIQTLFQKGDASTILIRDNDYIIKNKGGVTMCPSEQLPQELKLKLGMLKLSAVGTVVEGMGYRATDESFVIV